MSEERGLQVSAGGVCYSDALVSEVLEEQRSATLLTAGQLTSGQFASAVSWMAKT